MLARQSRLQKPVCASIGIDDTHAKTQCRCVGYRGWRSACARFRSAIMLYSCLGLITLGCLACTCTTLKPQCVLPYQIRSVHRIDGHVLDHGAE